MLLALLFALRDYTISARFGTNSMSASYWIVGELAVFLFWSLVTPLVLFVMNRFPLDRGVRLRNAALHLVIYCGLAALYSIYYYRVDLWQTPNPAANLRTSFLGIFYVAFADGLIKYYGPILVAGYIAVHYARLREQEFRAAALASQLTQAQLRALKMQLQPHFLFNTLHSISSLVYTDAQRADRMIAELSDLLRLTLEERDFVSVRQEIEYVKKYLQIEQTRFSDRLTAHFDVGPQTLDCLVPALILQPIVENAVKHGIARKLDGGTISVKTFVQGNWLHLRVHDNGDGLHQRNSTNSARQGVGLSNTRERLEQVYTENFELRVNSTSDSGTTVEILTPQNPTVPAAALPKESISLTMRER
jgi:two-component system LytT family sensor kinase